MGRFSFKLAFMPKYAKPHKSYDEQLAILVSRGLVNSDMAAAIKNLKRIGYYRFSAYTYPFREFNLEILDSRGRPQRKDTFFPGSKFEDAVAVYDYDESLRTALNMGLQQIEVGMRVQIGHTLGKRDPLGHEQCRGLDLEECEVVPGGDAAGETVFEKWIKRYDDLAKKARQEDYVLHFMLKYDAEFPIWVATEFMDFGSLTRLYSLLVPEDRKNISRRLGIRDSSLLHSWLKALNVLRNDCAHHNRVWNRVTATVPSKPHKTLVDDSELLHLRQVQNNRLYFLAALIAHMTIKLNPQTNWPRQFKTVAGGKKAPEISALPVHDVMGFPDGWRDLPIWNYDPSTSVPLRRG